MSWHPDRGMSHVHVWENSQAGEAASANKPVKVRMSLTHVRAIGGCFRRNGWKRGTFAAYKFGVVSRSHRVVLYRYWLFLKIRKNTTKRVTKRVIFFPSFLFSSFLLFFSFLFFTPQLRHMEVPGPGVESEPQLQAYTTATSTPDLSCICDLGHSLQQCWILNPLSKARDQIHILTDIRLGS